MDNPIEVPVKYQPLPDAWSTFGLDSIDIEPLTKIESFEKWLNENQ